MHIITFEINGARHAGVALAETAVSLAGAGYSDVLSFVAGGAEALAKAADYVANPPAEAVFPLADIKLLAPIPRPQKIICIGLNYHDHAIESKMALPEKPIVFSKYSTSVIATGENIVLPKMSTKPDYEAEFGVVIGPGGKNIKAADWKNHVYGYVNINDVSARDIQLGSSQWMMGKTFDTFCPMGPWLVTADEIADPHNLPIWLTVNGEKLQNSNTKELIFNIPHLIEYLSAIMTLEPGDIISTGTPAGVGLGYNPPKWLKPGDEVVVCVEGLGELKNTCVAEE